MRVFKKGGFANDVGDESTATGNTTNSGNMFSKDSQLSAQEEEEVIMANAAEIKTAIENIGKRWSTAFPGDRIIAASACPEGLNAELESQVLEARAAMAEVRV